MSESHKSSRQKIIKDSGHYVGSSVLGQVFGLVRAVLMPVFFSPAQLGIWNVLNLILSYCPHAQLGLTHGMNKSIPMMIGTGNKEEQKKIQNSVFWTNLFLSLLAMIGLLGSSFFVSQHYIWPIRILAIVVFVQMMYYFFFSLLRANSKFILVSNGIFLTSVLSTILVIGMLYLFPNPVIGGLIGMGIAILIVLIYWMIKGAYRFPYKIDARTIKACFMLGIPILGIGILESLTVSIDRIFIASNMSPAQLGYYALGIMISGIVGLIPGSVASVLYSTMLERYSINKDPKDVASLLIGPMRMMWALVAILICGIIIVIPGLIVLFLPKYIPAIPIVELLIFGSFFMSSSHVPGMFIIAINKQKFIIIAQICSICAVFLIDALLVHLGLGLRGIAIGTICGYIIYGVGYTAIALSTVVDNPKIVLKYIFWQVFPLLMLTGTFLFLNWILPYTTNTLQYILWAFVRLVILLALLTFYLWIVNRDNMVINFAKEELLKVLRRFNKKTA